MSGQFINCSTLISVGIPIDPITNGALVDENCQTKITDIFACGNVLQVHNLVDYISKEGLELK